MKNPKRKKKTFGLMTAMMMRKNSKRKKKSKTNSNRLPVPF